MVPRTLFDKIWEDHVVRAEADGTTLLYIDRHLVYEVTSPQAFEGLTVAGRAPRRPAAALAVPDHNVPTTDRSLPVADPVSAKSVTPEGAFHHHFADPGLHGFDAAPCH